MIMGGKTCEMRRAALEDEASNHLDVWMPNGVQKPLSALNGDNDKSFKEWRQEADAKKKERFTLLIGPIGCFHYCPCVSSLKII